MPVLNNHDLLSRALGSLAGQTGVDWELVLVDDGSNPPVADVVDAVTKDWPQSVRYVWQHNAGVAAARNQGLRRASGRYATFLDSDDTYKTEHLAGLVAYLDTNPEIDIVYQSPILLGDVDDCYVVDARDTRRRVHIDDWVCGATFCARPATFLQLGGFTSGILDLDYDFFSRASEQVRIVKILERTYIYHRDNPSSITHRRLQDFDPK